MILGFEMKNPDLYPAVSHVDGTTRPQILKKDMNSDFYEVVKGVGGIILNTSFNLAGDPIVETPYDALMTLKNSEMDAVIINDFLVEKNKWFYGYTESKISELYIMIFNVEPDKDTLKWLSNTFNEQNNSIDSLENYLRHSEKFKKLSIELKKELEITKLYYILLNHNLDIEDSSFFKNQVINENKTIDWVKE